MAGLPTVKDIYDNVHGHIPLTKIELTVIDSPFFQRLRRISQLCPVDLVYPGATHTRFAHSLGSLHIMEQYLQYLKRSGKKIVRSNKENQTLRLAALLHDVGHFPFSHTLEIPIERELSGPSHEVFGRYILKNFMSDILGDYCEDVVDLLMGNAPSDVYGLLLSSDFDVDKSDYLVRDSYHTGVAYGQIDFERLIRTMSLESDSAGPRIVFDKVGPALENFLMARYHMYQAVYFHKTVIAFELMIQRIYIMLVKEKFVDHPRNLMKSSYGDRLLRYDDSLIWQKMHDYLQKGANKFVIELIRMLMNRKPLSLAFRDTTSAEDQSRSNRYSDIKMLEEDTPSKKKFVNSVKSAKSGFTEEWLFPSLNYIRVIPDGSPIYVKRGRNTIRINEDKGLIFRQIGDRVLFESRIYTHEDYQTAVNSVFLNQFTKV